MNICRTFLVELYKFRKGKIWPVFLLGPLFGGFIAYYYSTLEGAAGGWLDIYNKMIGVYGLYLLPLLTGLIAAMICRYEHAHGGWKQYLAQPIRRWQVYAVKLLLASGSIAAIQFLMFLTLFGVGTLTGIEAPIPIKPIAISLFGGWLATFPLIALQLWVSTAWSSFAAPLALNVVFILPSLLIAGHAAYGPYYPWAQPLLAMAFPSDGMNVFTYLSAETLFIVVMGGFLVFFTGGLAFFQKRAY